MAADSFRFAGQHDSRSLFGNRRHDGGEPIRPPGKNPRNIVLAWILTLPACVLLGAATFSGALYIVFNVLHVNCE